jgi:YD repeat-containing protein
MVGTHEIQTGTQTLRTQLRYAALDGLKSATDANSHTATFALDGLNRKTSASFPGNFTESWSYDGEGILLSHTNRRGVTNTTTHDNQGRELTASAQGLNETVPLFSIVYDDAAIKETRTDGNNHSTTYTFDGLHRLITLTNADTQSRHLNYDGVNLISESDFKGQLTRYVYDPVNRVKEIKDRANQVTVIQHSDSNGYT